MNATGVNTRMGETLQQRQGVEQLQACGLHGGCNAGDCVRPALRRLGIAALAVCLLALLTGQIAWLLLAGLLLFTAAGLWVADRLLPDVAQGDERVRGVRVDVVKADMEQRRTSWGQKDEGQHQSAAGGGVPHHPG